MLHDANSPAPECAVFDPRILLAYLIFVFPVAGLCRTQNRQIDIDDELGIVFLRSGLVPRRQNYALDRINRRVRRPGVSQDFARPLRAAISLSEARGS